MSACGYDKKKSKYMQIKVSTLGDKLVSSLVLFLLLFLSLSYESIFIQSPRHHPIHSISPCIFVKNICYTEVHSKPISEESADVTTLF